MEHRLKTWPEEFQATLDGRKTFEYQLDDRGGYKVGDTLVLQEWQPDQVRDGYALGHYTGRVFRAQVAYVLQKGFGLPEGYVVLSIFPA